MMSPPATPTEVCAPSRARRLCRHRPRGWSCGIRSGGRRPRSARGGTGSIGIRSPSRSSRRTRRSTRLPWRSRAPVPTPTGAAVQIRRNEPPPQARSLSSAAGSSPPLRATASRASRPSRPATYASSCRLSRLNQDLGLPARRPTHMPMTACLLGNRSYTCGGTAGEAQMSGQRTVSALGQTPYARHRV